ncbi:Peroxiredoxin-2E-1, related [Neospora caninum Liverpool]|uniref:Peroxiredoxin-2E-1, related n=1 Tax=Neospora caninum (strain Liverpool) TaxID=572307 RepID=F0VD93_NEOCL|nr:Peroxiredoxin-2E-1, related [Neospora caninum Liverpool]CBZ51608.1 Peroxiredoxin-2E-1, related [Neospora caninum Liverpool]CEL65559.1 TPA: Peroxiredoxin-2E-1, related [Neospora caninum Liverpool]|eukprot:XP_003881641.1 Peroxiredoxin-2E-1, related [Neospora caninum Liverpool]
MAKVVCRRAATMATFAVLATALLWNFPTGSFSFVIGTKAVGSVPLAPAASSGSMCSSASSGAASVFSSRVLQAASAVGAGSLAFARTKVLSEGDPVPGCVWRVRTAAPNGEKTWADLESDAMFKNKRVVVFSLPGAFTPTCSSRHLPDFEKEYESILSLGVDEVYCLSVNDSFVMNAWASSLNVKNVKMIPDGNGCFTSRMGMLVDKTNLGFGPRSWRYAMVVRDGIIEKLMVEPEKRDDAEDDPFVASDVGSVLKYLREAADVKGA